MYDFNVIAQGQSNCNGCPGTMAGYEFQAPMGTVPPFTITSIPAVTNVAAGSSAGTPVTVTVSPVSGGSTPSQVTFYLSNGGYSVQTTVNRPASTPAGSPWPATFVVHAPSYATNGLITISASGNGVTVPFQMMVNVAPPFNLSVSPGSQTANVAGGASYQVTVSGITGSVVLSLAVSPALPSGSSASFSQSPITAPGVSLLSVNVPPLSAATTYNLTVSATSGSLGTSVTVPFFVNPPTNTVPASMISPAPGWNLSGVTATFTWSSGVGVSQYRLLVGSSPGASDYLAVNTGSSQSTTASWPATSQAIYVSLGSLISGAWQSNSYIYAVNPQSSHVAPRSITGAGGNNVCGVTSTGGYYVYNNDQEVICTYNETNGGDDSEYTSCTSADPNIKARLVSVSPASMQIGYAAQFNATTGNKTITCDWEYIAPNGTKTSFPNVSVAGGRDRV
jgi:hypothetical protein